jgi:hypothetical protein
MLYRGTSMSVIIIVALIFFSNSINKNSEKIRNQTLARGINFKILKKERNNEI